VLCVVQLSHLTDAEVADIHIAIPLSAQWASMLYALHTGQPALSSACWTAGRQIIVMCKAVRSLSCARAGPAYDGLCSTVTHCCIMQTLSCLARLFRVACCCMCGAWMLHSLTTTLTEQHTLFVPIPCNYICHAQQAWTSCTLQVLLAGDSKAQVGP
jgi:hypothetical protein